MILLGIYTRNRGERRIRQRLAAWNSLILLEQRAPVHRDAISEDCNSIRRSRRPGIRAVTVTVTHDIVEPPRYPTHPRSPVIIWNSGISYKETRSLIHFFIVYSANTPTLSANSATRIKTFKTDVMEFVSSSPTVIYRIK